MKRHKAKNDFEKDFCKLLNPSFYGKTIENVRNRCKVDYIKKMIIKKLLNNNQN